MEYTISAHNGDSVKIEALNWMHAMGQALAFFGADIFELGRIACSPGEDGSVFVDAPGASRTWMIRPARSALRVIAAAGTSTADPVAEPRDPTEELPIAPPPALTMPLSSSLHREAPVAIEEEEEESLAERLFDLGMELSAASPDEASQMALDLVLELVPVEAASVARGTLNDAYLTFVAASGPVADEILGREVNFGVGLVGMSFDLCATLLVHDVASDNRHLERIDAETGFRTTSALCVAISDGPGRAHGVIQLLNPAAPFTQEQIQTVESVARTLAGALSGASFDF